MARNIAPRRSASRDASGRAESMRRSRAVRVRRRAGDRRGRAGAGRLHPAQQPGRPGGPTRRSRRRQFPETPDQPSGARQTRRDVPARHRRAHRDRPVQRPGVRGHPRHQGAVHRAWSTSGRTARSTTGSPRRGRRTPTARSGRSPSSRAPRSPTASRSTPRRSSAAGSAPRPRRPASDRRRTTSTRSRASTRCRTAARTTLSGVDATDPNTLKRRALGAGLRVRPAHRRARR